MEIGPRDKPIVQPADRDEWRTWLAENHDSSTGVWLALVKKSTGRQVVRYEDAVEELLCFGWIDSKQNPLDEERYLIWCTPRKKGGIWSRPNKERIERLEASGQMTDVGRTVIEQAKSDGSWEFLDEIDNLIVPPDLRAALDASSAAAEHWDGFPEGAKKQALYWIKSAKRSETRTNRIEQIVEAAARGERIR